MPNASSRRRVLLLELNEITWDLVEPWMEEGKLPTFLRLRRSGAWGVQEAVERPPALDPWITWTTAYSGVPQSEHNVHFLEQPPDTIRARRLWEICHQNGLSVGTFGSLCSWPPRPVKGFFVPGTFSPDPATYPEELRPIQELNLTYTRSIRLPSDADTVWFRARLGWQLLRLGLGGRTAARLGAQLASELWRRDLRWKRVALQPIVNLDFFEKLYRRCRPDFATFHTNHAAHYMHTYWKAMQPERFPQATERREVEAFGGAVEHGYRVADEILSRALGLMDPRTVLIVASSMGQKPHLSASKKGKAINQIRSLPTLMEILGFPWVEALFTMSGQFNLSVDSAELRRRIEETLRAAYLDRPDRPLFSIDVLEHSLRVDLCRYEDSTLESRCYFPHQRRFEFVPYGELVHETGMVKSGCHDPRGVLMIYGPGVRPGLKIDPTTNLDLAPTVLHLLGLAVPSYMKGRILSEALEDTTVPATTLAPESRPSEALSI